MWDYFIHRNLRTLFTFYLWPLYLHLFLWSHLSSFFWLIFMFMRAHWLNDFFINIFCHIIIYFLNPFFKFINFLLHVVIDIIIHLLYHIVIDFLNINFLNIIIDVFIHLFITLNCHFFIHCLLLMTLLSYNEVFLFPFRTFGWWFYIFLCLNNFSNNRCFSSILINKGSSSIALEVYLSSNSIFSRTYRVKPNGLFELIQGNVDKLLGLFNIFGKGEDEGWKYFHVVIFLGGLL